MATTKAATAGTGGSTPKPKSPTTTKGSGGSGWGSTRTTSAVRAGKTVSVCYDSNMWEIKCPKKKTLSAKDSGIVVGVIVGVVALIALISYIYKKRKLRQRAKAGVAEEGEAGVVQEKGAESPGVVEAEKNPNGYEYNTAPAVGYEYDAARTNSDAPGQGEGYQPPAPTSYETPAPQANAYQPPAPIQNDYQPPAPTFPSDLQPQGTYTSPADSGFQPNAAPRPT